LILENPFHRSPSQTFPKCSLLVGWLPPPKISIRNGSALPCTLSTTETMVPFLAKRPFIILIENVEDCAFNSNRYLNNNCAVEGAEIPITSINANSLTGIFHHLMHQ